jgi:hypothetical protein
MPNKNSNRLLLAVVAMLLLFVLPTLAIGRTVYEQYKQAEESGSPVRP